MKHKILMTLALLITAVGGAWAQTQWESGDCTVTLSNGTLTVSGNGAMADYTSYTDRPWHDNRSDITSVVVESGVTTIGSYVFFYFSNLTSVTLPEGLTSIGVNGIRNCGKLTSITIPSTVTSIGSNAFYGCTSVTDVYLYADPANMTWNEGGCDDFKQGGYTKCHVLAEHLSAYQTNFIGKVNVTFVGDLKPLATSDIDVTTNAASEQDLFTEASFTMPTSDVTVNYTLVRDMQDEANPVAFSGLPSSGNIVVKKGSDGKYQPAEALTIQLIDPLAAAEAQNIIAADGITVKVLVGAENEKGAIDYDQDNPITLEAFLADMKPGYYWIKAESTDENSPYDGTVYSSEFTVVEKYDLTVKPANDFSKNGLDAVTVGSESVTPDANTGEATKTGIAPDTEVKLKANEGYKIKSTTAKQKEGETTVTVTINETKTEATFAMPAFDATATYELVRDMTVDMPVTIGDGKDGYRVRVEKADGKWKLADMTDAELMAKVKVRDSIEHKDLVFYGNDAVCGMKIYALSAEGKPTGDPITKATMVPGSFVIVATAKEGSAYEGTSTSNTFELYVKSDLTLSASNYTIESGAATIKVDGTDKSAAIAEGKLAGIEMGAKVSLAANTAYVMSDVTVTSGDNKVTITTADGVSSFAMPDSAATMAYTIKRDITQKVTIQIADRVRLEKKDGKYDAVDPFELIPILTDKIGETDKNMFLGETTGTSGDFYIKGMQKLDGENWVDATELNIGTYRVVIAGMLNYDGTIYTDPIELYMGYEITVAAGEYASYYSAEALTTEDADAELYTIASVTDTEAVLSDKIKVAPKETPLLVYNKSEESKTFLLIPTTENADEVTVAKEFMGSLTEGEIPASSAVADYYALNGKAFVWVKYAIEIGANKCWLQIGDQPAAARAMTRSIVGGGDTTGIDSIEQIDDAQSGYYDLNGRKLQGKPNKKGVYIKNGKKVVVR